MAAAPFAGASPAHVVGLLGAPVGGLGPALARIVVEQLAGESAENFAGTAASHGAGMATASVPGADLLVAHVVALATMVQGWEPGPLGLALTLVWPLGGPVWGGLVPVHTSVAVLRRASAAVRALPATRSGAATAIVDTGRVTLRVVIVDDSVLFRDLAARALVRDGLEVVGLAATVAEALQLVRETAPDVALVDLHLGTESGLDVARQVAASAATTRPAVVVMSTHGESEVRELLPGSGATGFLPKEHLSGDALRVIVGAAP